MSAPQELISDYEIEESKKNLREQIVSPLSRRGALEAGLFSI